jgi:hypothetical protein
LTFTQIFFTLIQHAIVLSSFTSGGGKVSSLVNVELRYGKGWWGIPTNLFGKMGALHQGNPADSRLEIFTPGDFGSGQSACAVAGVIALMKSVNPFLSAAQLRSILLDPSSTTPVPASEGVA